MRKLLLLGIPPNKGRKVPGLVKLRPPSICKGCGHADTFKAPNEAIRPFGQGWIFSDIGCYTLGAASHYINIPFNSPENAVRKLFGHKGMDIVDINLTALKAGRDYCAS